MQINIKNLLFSNIILKVVSFIIGATFWFIISQSHTRQLHREIPICFYGQQPDSTIDAPDTLRVTLRGTRAHLNLLDLDALALHIDAAKLHMGPNQISVNNATLFLPEQINVVHYSPLNGVITVQAKKISAQSESATHENATA
jgi:hypothetical protein